VGLADHGGNYGRDYGRNQGNKDIL
jgi:hypothetical protein